MSYALIKDGQVSVYPYSFAALRRDNPQVSFPREPSDEFLAGFDVHAVAAVDQPAYDLTKNIVEGTPALVNGVWTQAWAQEDASAEEIAARQQDADDEAARLAAKADNFVQSFTAMTPAQDTAYVDANVTNLTSAKALLSKMALMMLLLARRGFRDAGA
jgi:hypothetical protein